VTPFLYVKSLLEKIPVVFDRLRREDTKRLLGQVEPKTDTAKETGEIVSTNENEKSLESQQEAPSIGQSEATDVYPENLDETKQNKAETDAHSESGCVEAPVEKSEVPPVCEETTPPDEVADNSKQEAEEIPQADTSATSAPDENDEAFNQALTGNLDRKPRRKNSDGDSDDEWMGSETSSTESESDAECVDRDVTVVKVKKGNAAVDPYFAQPIGALLFDIGMSLVKECVALDALNATKRKYVRAEQTKMYKVMSETYEKAKLKNKNFKLKKQFCRMCSFEATSCTVMARHLETPHVPVHSTLMRCNFCPFTSRFSPEMRDHFRIEHKRVYRLEEPEPRFWCPMCPYEDQMKVRFKHHTAYCERRFVPEKNLDVRLSWEPPCVTRPPQPASNQSAVTQPPGQDPSTSANPSSSAVQSPQVGRNSFFYHYLMPREHIRDSEAFLNITARSNRPMRTCQAPTWLSGRGELTSEWECFFRVQ
jgi:hypothetical protein